MEPVPEHHPTYGVHGEVSWQVKLVLLTWVAAAVWGTSTALVWAMNEPPGMTWVVAMALGALVAVGGELLRGDLQ
jgi:NhaP-type Na+/H+ or K+/H+ antiporter